MGSLHTFPHPVHSFSAGWAGHINAYVVRFWDEDDNNVVTLHLQAGELAALTDVLVAAIHGANNGVPGTASSSSRSDEPGEHRPGTH